jgi:hypothetical protein
MFVSTNCTTAPFVDLISAEAIRRTEVPNFRCDDPLQFA